MSVILPRKSNKLAITNGQIVSNWVSEILCNKLQSVAELPRVLVKVVGGNFLDVSFEVFGVDYSGRTF